VVADDIAEWLAEKDITHVFGIVGGGNVVLWDAITRLKKTKIVCVHHEQAATMAASYYARTKDSVGVAIVTTGGGSTNALTGVMAAYMDRTPLMVISGNEQSRFFHSPVRVRGTQGYDSAFLVAPCTKYAIQPLHKTTEVLERAYRIALEAPQGPVWVDIPKDVQSGV
jgi:acetolactate synthase I/II/III large subunit